jgi:hypothetical protein
VKALTLWRPWDRAILFGGKDCENRGQPCPMSVIGETIALHAGKTYRIGDWAFPGGWTPPPADRSPTGIVGVARVLGCLDRRDPARPRYLLPTTGDNRETYERLQRLHLDPWWSGPCGILLGERVAIDPIACNGAMGWWTVPGNIEPLVHERVRAARAA